MAPIAYNLYTKVESRHLAQKGQEGEIYQLTSETNLSPVFSDSANFALDILKIQGQSTLWFCRMILSAEDFFFSFGRLVASRLLMSFILYF
jgi:hypothetical protein